MNLHFFSPIYLLGLLGMALPILIHYLTLRREKHIKFSAVYLLLQSQKRSIKRSRPNRLLLLLTRCLAIACLSLALAHPIFSVGKEDMIASTPVANVIFFFMCRPLLSQIEENRPGALALKTAPAT